MRRIHTDQLLIKLVLPNNQRETKEKVRFACDESNYETEKTIYLKPHKLSQHGSANMALLNIKPFKCSICKKGFKLFFLLLPNKAAKRNLFPNFMNAEVQLSFGDLMAMNCTVTNICCS